MLVILTLKREFQELGNDASRYSEKVRFNIANRKLIPFNIFLRLNNSILRKCNCRFLELFSVVFCVVKTKSRVLILLCFVLLNQDANAVWSTNKSKLWNTMNE